jgi:ABC-2 type transport system permease protein
VSGALFPVSVLPGWLQALSRASPLTYALRALRHAIIDGASLLSLGSDLLVVTAFAAATGVAGTLALAAGFAHARRRGRLATF